MDFSLSDDQQALIDRVRSYLESQITPALLAEVDGRL